MTHLGLGSSLEEPWGGLLGGVEEGLPSWEVLLTSWGDWVALCLGGALTALPKRPGWITALTCLGRPRGLR